MDRILNIIETVSESGNWNLNLMYWTLLMTKSVFCHVDSKIK